MHLDTGEVIQTPRLAEEIYIKEEKKKEEEKKQCYRNTSMEVKKR